MNNFFQAISLAGIVIFVCIFVYTSAYNSYQLLNHTCEEAEKQVLEELETK